MPNHFHLLITPAVAISLEKALQFIKGGFSCRARKELGFKSEIWQVGFTNHRIHDAADYDRHRSYIHENSRGATRGTTGTLPMFLGIPWRGPRCGATVAKAHSPYCCASRGLEVPAPLALSQGLPRLLFSFAGEPRRHRQAISANDEMEPPGLKPV